MYKLLVLFTILFQQQPFMVKSVDFANNHYIPRKFTCEGMNYSPGLRFDNIPHGTKSIALIVDDPDSPNGEFVHWVMWNIPVSSKIAENGAPGIQGKNSMNENRYYGPCPPNGIHTYQFKAYALNSTLQLSKESGKAELIKAMEGHVIAESSIKGLYRSKE